jgi:predicted nucleic acid-binding Zn ribbon protein
MKLKEIILGKRNAEQADSLKHIQREWPWIVGDSIAEKSRPVKLTDNCLTIKTDTYRVQSELSFLRVAVANRIREKHNIKITKVLVRG